MIRLTACVLLAGAFWAGSAFAEPYIAVRTGLKCTACHVNPTGGGMRNTYGNTYAQHTLAARYLDRNDGQEQAQGWTGSLNRYVRAGADFRGEFAVVDTPGEPDISEYVYEESLLYLELRPVLDSLSLYLDTRLGPGDARTREAYGLLRLSGQTVFVKAGRFFLPFGLRLEDDEALTRSVSGIGFQTPEDGVEVGLEQGPWSAQLAVTNGAGGGGEVDDDKRLVANAVYTRPGWRVGASAGGNETAAGSRDMTAVYAGIRTGPVGWLFEYDRIIDEPAGGGEIEQQVGLIEANTLLSPGNNLKLTYEIHEPDDAPGTEDRSRASVVWEYFPVQFVQFSVGLRSRDGPDSLPAANRERAFVQLHLFF